MTLATVVVVALLTALAVYRFGPAEAEERIGCGIVHVVDRTLSLEQPCH